MQTVTFGRAPQFGKISKDRETAVKQAEARYLDALQGQEPPAHGPLADGENLVSRLVRYSNELGDLSKLAPKIAAKFWKTVENVLGRVMAEHTPPYQALQVAKTIPETVPDAMVDFMLNALERETQALQPERPQRWFQA